MRHPSLGEQSREVSPTFCCMFWDVGLSKSDHVGQLAPKLQLPTEGACDDFSTRFG